MDDLYCIGCGDTFNLDFEDMDGERLYCRRCEMENSGIGINDVADEKYSTPYCESDNDENY